MCNYSSSNKINYEFVVQSRFDLIFNKKIDLNKLSKKKLHLVNAQHIQTRNQLNDIFFISNQRTSLHFRNIYKNLKKYPIDSTNILPIFLKEYQIKYENTFKFKNIIIKRFYDQYFNLSILSFIFLKIKAGTKKLVNIIIKSLNKILFVCD